MGEAKIKKILITGADGMLGTDVVYRLSRNKKFKLDCSTIEDMDITDLRSVKERLLKSRPDIIIHTAAYTNVDGAEKEPEACFAVNAEGTKNLAFFCRELEAEMLYISSDYVFDGRKRKPYLEEDQPHPLNVYGASKLKGEKYVSLLLSDYKVVRTSWLNGPFGVHRRNFIETIVQAAARKKELAVVNDQWGKPTFTFHLAGHIEKLLDIKEWGIFHITSEGICTWYEFAQRILELAELSGIKIKPIKTKEFRSLARRPLYSALENKRIRELGLAPMPHWEEGLRQYFEIRRKQGEI